MSNHYKMPQQHQRRRSELSDRAASFIALAVLGAVGAVAFVSCNNGVTAAKPPQSELQTVGQRVPVSIAHIIEPSSEVN